MATPSGDRVTPVLVLDGHPIRDPGRDEAFNTDKAANTTPDRHSDQAQGSLGDILRAYQVQHLDSTPASPKVFWSDALLKRLVTRDRVINELSLANISKSEAETLCKCIVPQHDASGATPLKTYLRIFALLALGSRSKDIRKFVREGGLCDDELPVGETNIYPCFREWNEFEIEWFKMKQCGVRVQYFDMDSENKVKHYRIQPGTLLPWLKDNGHGSGECKEMDGGFGTVRKYRIDPDSHGFSQVLKSVELYSEWIAVKSLKKPQVQMDEDTFNKEVDNLKRFGGQVHRSLITLLATYTLGGHYHFLFPAAECDLDEYWRETKGPLTDPKDISVGMLRWISKQIVGIVEALKFIHEGKKILLETEDKFGRHGDLKPENILWFKSSASERGIFVITDLGIADIHRDQSKSNIPNQGLPHSPGYRPPECDIKGGTISRAYDVWTLGCVLLEMVCWLLGGDEARAEFKKDRTSPYVTGVSVDIFFDIVDISGQGYGVEVKKKVTEWISLLHNKPGCTPYVHDLLDLICDKMLIASSGGRQRTPILLKSLNEMQHRTRVNDYIKKPQAEPRPKRPQQPHPVELSDNLRETLCKVNLYRAQLDARRAAMAGAKSAK